jgi:hypothetical protein
MNWKVGGEVVAGFCSRSRRIVEGFGGRIQRVWWILKDFFEFVEG